MTRNYAMELTQDAPMLERTKFKYKGRASNLNVSSKFIDETEERRYYALAMQLSREESAVLGLPERFVAGLLQLNLLAAQFLDDRDELAGREELRHDLDVFACKNPKGS